jgi:hypothetical protein
MRKLSPIILLPAFILPVLVPFETPAQGIAINAGTKLVFSGSTYVEIATGNLTNNGVYTRAGETIKFSGNGTPQEIKGSQSISLNNLTIATGAVVHIPAGNYVTVSGTLTNNAGIPGQWVNNE